MNRLRKYQYLCVLSLLCCLPGFAATVYKSIDANGVVSFSDTHPKGDVMVETMVIEELAPAANELSDQRLQDIRETTDRMAADRMAREKHRAELRQLNAPEYAPPVPQQMDSYYEAPVIYDGYPDYTGTYPYPARRSPRRPDYPAHPITTPPLLPPGTVYSPDFDYPAKLIRKHYDPKVRAAVR